MKTSEESGGEQRARTLLNREMNPPETSNREMSGSDQLSESSGCQLTVSEQHHKMLVSERKAEQANRALTLKGRRLWCRRCHWFGHWGGWEGILGGCAEGIGDLWAQGADTLCFPFYLWHCKTTENGSRQKHSIIQKYSIWDKVAFYTAFPDLWKEKSQLTGVAIKAA